MRHKKDTNHDEVVAELRQYGYDVADTYKAGRCVPGLPDCIVEKAGWVRLVEIKRRGKVNQLTDSEKRFHAEHPGMVIVATCAEDVEEHYQREIDR